MSEGDEICPGSETQLTDAVLYGCEAESGVWFAGVAEYIYSEDTESGTYTEYLTGDFLMEEVDGTLFEAGGRIARYRYETESGLEYEAQLFGSWILTPSQTWLDPLNSLFLSLALSAAGTLVAEGAWGRGNDALYLEHLTWDGLCEGHPVGLISVREPAGIWYTLALEDPCTGCGQMIWGDGVQLGEACVELRDAGVELAGRLADWL
jgi:hypothetical protein